FLSHLIQFHLRDKHLHIAKDSELLKTIYRKVEEELVINKSNFYVKILTKFLCYFGLLALCYWSLFSIIHPIIFIGCFVFFGILSLLIAFNFGHDLSHNSIFKN